MTTIAFALMFYYVHLYTFCWVTFAVTFAWGMQDATLNNLVNCTLGFEFEDKLTPFSVQNFVQPLFVFAFMLVQAQIKTRQECGETIQYTIYFGCCLGMAWIALLILLSFDFRGKR